MTECLGRTEKIELSWRRWPILLVISINNLLSSAQYMHFVSVPDIFRTYYGVGSQNLTWTGTIFMASAIIFLLPTIFLIDNTGIRKIGLLLTSLSTVGCIIKCVAIHPDRYWLLFIGQFISSIPYGCLPPMVCKVAAAWFPANRIATATSIGYGSLQIGYAIGFLYSAFVVLGPKSSFLGVSGENGVYNDTFPSDWLDESWSEDIRDKSIAEVSVQIWKQLLPFAIIAALNFMFSFWILRDFPDKVPSKASRRSSSISFDRKKDLIDRINKTFENSLKVPSDLRIQIRATLMDVRKTVSNLFKSSSFRLHYFSYGLVIGASFAFFMLLNQLIKKPFMDDENDEYDDLFLSKLNRKIGLMGAILQVIGMFGSFSGGIILDKFKNYKLVNSVTYAGMFVLQIIFTFTVGQKSIVLDFFTVILIGLFSCSYASLAFQLLLEITYPEPEGTTTAVFYCSQQIFGLIITTVAQALLDTGGDSSDGSFYANVFILCCMGPGLIMALLIKEECKRSAAEKESRSTLFSLSFTSLQPGISTVSSVIPSKTSLRNI